MILEKFKTFIKESENDLANINKNVGSKEVTVFMGRFQPPSKMHIDIIKKTYNKFNNEIVIAIVNNKSIDERHPFDYSIQEEIFKKALINVKYSLININTGFIGEFVDILRKEDKEPTVLICGSDRVKTYNEQLKRYKETLNLNINIFEIKRNSEDISSTKIRSALRVDDYIEFKNNVDKTTYDLYKKMKSYMV